MSDAPLILILDDDPDDRDLLRDVISLRQPNALFIVHQTPIETLRYFENAEVQIPDLFLFDLNMPVLTGDELVASLRQDGRFAELPMFIVTTSSHPHDKERCLAKGATGFFVKPPKYDLLVQLADWLLSIARGAATKTPGL